MDPEQPFFRQVPIVNDLHHALLDQEFAEFAGDITKIRATLGETPREKSTRHWPQSAGRSGDITGGTNKRPRNQEGSRR